MLFICPLTSDSCKVYKYQSLPQGRTRSRWETKY